MDKITASVAAATAPGRAAQGREPRTTGSPAIDTLRRKAGIREYTCGLCGEEFGSNCHPGNIQCTGDECEARLCPCCGAWFTEDGSHSHPATKPAPELAAPLVIDVPGELGVRLGEAEQQLDEDERTISDYRNEVTRLMAERDSLTGRVAELEAEVGELRGLVADASRAAENLMTRNSELHTLAAEILDEFTGDDRAAAALVTPERLAGWRARKIAASGSPDGGGGRDGHA